MSFVRPLAAHKLVLALAAIVATTTSTRALAASGGLYAPVVEGGYAKHTGTTGSSITGMPGYVLILGSEGRKGFFRPRLGFDLEMSSGTTTIGSSTVDYSMWGANFILGSHFFVFQTGRFLPFIGGGGLIGWNYLSLTAPPTGTEPYTHGLAFGYEISGGIDMRFGSAAGNAVRLRGSYSKPAGSLGGISGFSTEAWRILLGVVF